ncbi:MAG: hypothetical protein KAT41_01410 [Candidatus Marinimicrobia bacterium]|nr:hypothetical protein [Candidatus Neomarinimicrobiota bacterium]
MNKRKFFIPLFLIITWLIPDISLAQFHRHWNLFERDFGAIFAPGIYRSYGSLFVNITKKNNIYVWEEDEFKLYKDLLYQSVKPEYLLTEFTFYPTATFSALMQKEFNDTYNHFNIYKDFNIIESLGGGIQEPWSFSLFFGQLATFIQLTEDEELIVAASGLSGLVLTGGLYQIFDNCIIRSNWARLEWKLKGEGGQKEKNYSWDIKIGYRLYGIHEIPNTATFLFSRSRTDKKRSHWQMNKNSMTDLELQLPVTEIRTGFSKVLISYGKVFPCWKFLIGLKFGLEFENRREYIPEIKTFSSEKNRVFSLIIQPVVIF